ncbi:MAG: S8 family serine peptidase [Candidatus Kapaibacterium sp.]|jgi:subtilisin family serine protease
MKTLLFFTILAFATLNPLGSRVCAQPYAHSYTDTTGGGSYYHSWPPPDSAYVHDVIVIKFRRGTLDYSQLNYNCDSLIAGSGLTVDSFMYFPRCKDSLFRQHLPLTVILDTGARSILANRGVAYLTRLTAANPLMDTLSRTRYGDTIPMDPFDWLEAQFANDTSAITALADLYGAGLPTIELATPVYLGSYENTPNDPQFGVYQTSLSTTMIGMEKAWDFETGGTWTDAGSYPYPHGTVAVIDNGLDYWRDDLGGGLGATLKVIGGYDFEGYTDHCLGHQNKSSTGFFAGACVANGANHGTPIASIIAAYTNNFAGIAGIAGGWASTSDDLGSKLLGYTVTDISSSSPCGHEKPRSDDIFRSIMDAVVHSVYSPLYGYGCDVINASWTFQYHPLELRCALSVVFQNHATFVACTGNDGNSAIKFPCSYEPASEVLSVGASKASKERISYSNHNPGIDIIAPGGEDGDPLDYGLDADLNDCILHSSGTPDNFSYHGGTSFAAPHATGIAANLRHFLSVTDPQEYYREDIEGIIKASALDIGPGNGYTTDPYDGFTNRDGYDTHTGWGFLKADNLFEMMASTTLSPNPGMGYKLFHLEVSSADFAHMNIGTWSGTSTQRIPMYFYDPTGYTFKTTTSVPTGHYFVRWRKNIAAFDYSGLHLSTTSPNQVYAWGCSLSGRKEGWSFYFKNDGSTFENFEEPNSEMMCSYPKDSGWAQIPGINHTYSTKLSACTYQYEIWDDPTSPDSLHHCLGIFPNGGEFKIAVTILGVPCPTCKKADESESLPLQPQFSIWPSIASTQVAISISNNPLGGKFDLIDCLGRVVYQRQVDPGRTDFNLSTVELASGLYTGRLTSGNYRETKRIVVIH